MGRPKGSKNKNNIHGIDTVIDKVISETKKPEKETLEDLSKTIKTKHLTPVRSIRAKCMECNGGQYSEVKECACNDCPLYPYRLGKNSNRKGHTGGFKKKENIESEDDFGKEE